MTVISISWYLSGLFATALALSSAITVAPGVSTFRITGIPLALTIFFTLVAVIFKWFRVPQPKWLLRLFQCFAVLATLAVLFGVLV